MLTKILLPHRYQLLGWILFLLLAVLLSVENYLSFSFSWLDFEYVQEDGLFGNPKENFTNEFALIGIFISLFLIALCREKEEDEYIQKLRLNSLLMASYVNTLILMLGKKFFYCFGYLEFMVYNIFAIQLIFIDRFSWVLFKQQNSVIVV